MKRKILFALACLLASPALFSEIVLANAKDAVRIAAANDWEGAVRRQNARENERLARLSITPFLPEFDFSISDSASASPASGDYKQKAIEAGVTQKIFSGGRNYVERKMLLEKSRYQFLEVLEAEENEKNAIVQGYYGALLSLLEKEALAGALDAARAVLSAAELKAEHGLISKTEFLESKIQFMQMEMQAKNAGDAFLSARRALCQLMNLDFREEIVFLEAQNGDFFAELGLEKKGRLMERIAELTQQALEKSVGLKKARAEVEWAKKQRSLLKKSFLPELSLRAGFSANGRSWPLTEPSYSLKVIMSFDKNPWLPMSVSRSAGAKKGALASVTDSVSGKGILDLTWPVQLKMSKIGIERGRIEAEKTKRQLESRVFELIKGIEKAEDDERLRLESVRLKEQKLLLSEIQLEQGAIKMTDYLDDLNGLAAEKIQFLRARTERDSLLKTLEDMTKGGIYEL